MPLDNLSRGQVAVGIYIPHLEAFKSWSKEIADILAVSATKGFLPTNKAKSEFPGHHAPALLTDMLVKIDDSYVMYLLD